jgi:DNA-binding transcriptional ArsR family regulator
MSHPATPGPEDELGRTLAALADPTRRSILEQLSLGPASVGELARPYDMSQPAVSKHVKVLERAGLVSQAPGGRLGPRRLELGPLLKAAEWLDTYARIWTVRSRHFGHRRGAVRAAAPRR